LTSIVGPLLATNLFAYFISAGAPFHLPEIPFLLGALLFALAFVLAIRTFYGRSHNQKLETGN